MKTFKLVENNSYTNIDGFLVGTSKDFIPTIEYIEKMFNAFNVKYFNSQLFLITPKEIKESFLSSLFPNRIIIEIKSYSGSLGECKVGLYCKDKDETPLLYVVEKLIINSKYLRSEKNYCEILLHEMIHIWEYQALNKGRVGHSKEFLDKKEEINKKGWNIITEELEDNLKDRGLMNIQEIINNFKLLIFKRGNSLGSYLVPKEDLQIIVPNFSYNNFLLELYQILEYNTLLDSPIFNRHIDMEDLSLRLTSLEEVDSLVKENKIRLEKLIKPTQTFKESSSNRASKKEGIEILDNGRIIKYPPRKLGNGWIVTEMIVKD